MTKCYMQKLPLLPSIDRSTDRSTERATTPCNLRPATCSLADTIRQNDFVIKSITIRIPRPYGQCRRAAFPRSSRPGSSRRRSSNSLNCRRYKIIDTCCCTEAVHTYGYRQGRVTLGEAAAHVTGTQRRGRSRTGARNLATTPAREVVKAFPGAILKTRM